LFKEYLTDNAATGILLDLRCLSTNLSPKLQGANLREESQLLSFLRKILGPEPKHKKQTR